MSKALGIVSIARKGGRIERGEEPTGAAARAGKARLILVASDASEHAVRRVKSFVSGTKQPWLQVPFTKLELGQAMGQPVCAMAAITDVSLAQAFVQALDEPEKYAALSEELAGRVERVRQRAREEKAHRNNVKHGGK